MPVPSVWTPAFKVFTNAKEENQPIVVASPDGRFTIAWSGELPTNSNSVINSYTYAGTTFGTNGVGAIEAQVSGIPSTLNRTNPDVAFLTNGDRVTVYEVNTDIVMQTDTKNADGTYSLGGTVLVNVGNTTGNQYQPEIAASSDGGYVIAWESINSGPTIVVNAFDASGILKAGYGYASVSTALQAGDNAYNLDLISLSATRYAVSYMTNDAGTTKAEVTIRNIGNPDISFTSDGTTGRNYETALAKNGYGEICFAFNGNNGSDTVFRIISANQTSITPDIVLTDVRNTGETPRVTGLADGRFMVVYSSSGSGPLIGQMINRDGTLDGASIVISANGYQAEIETLADQRVAVTWREGSGAAGDIYAAVYDPRTTGAYVLGTDGKDNYVGSIYNDLISTGRGGDTILGMGGNDEIYADSGANLVVGGAGNDSITASEQYADLGINTIFGEDGDDYIVVYSAERAYNNAILSGGAGNDTIIGASGNNYLYGGSGNDSLVGNFGNDLLVADSGDDTIEGGAGNDYFYSGTGVNDMFGGNGNDVFISEGSVDIMFGGAGHNYYYRVAAGTAAIFGSTEIDEFTGGNAMSNDTFRGGGGQDYAFGGNGNDLLMGGDGDDLLLGQNGNDTLDGGAGVNLLWANDAGSDQILVNVADGGTQVLDFFEAGGTNDFVRILGSSLTSFAGIQNLVNNLGTVQGNNLLVMTGTASQLYLNLGANQTAIWFQGINAYSLTSADFVFA